MNLPRKIKHFFFKIGFLFLFMIPILMHAQSSRTSFTSNNGKSKITHTSGGTEYQIEYEGKITLNDTDTDIIAISRGGFIKISKSAFGSKRKIEITSEDGGLVKKYYVGNTKTDFEPEGKKWLAEVLPEIIRTTTLGAEARVDRFYQRGGSSAVLAEIRKLEGDYVKSAYFDLLLKKTPNAYELSQIARTASQEIDSDHYLSQILRQNQKAFLSSSEGSQAYIEAAKSLDSDHYMTEVLKAAISNKNVSDNNLSRLLEVSSNLDSDHYRSEILSSLLSERSLSGENLSTLLRLTKGMDSDHYKSEVLKRALNSNSISDNAYSLLLESVDEMDSDHYKQEVLSRVLSKGDISKNNFDQILRASVSMDSDHYFSEILNKIARINNLSEDQLVKSLEAIGNMDSDHYIVNALVAFADKVKASGSSAKDAYKTTARRINSEHYYGRALKALEN